jgi:hypothetical protein
MYSQPSANSRHTPKLTSPSANIAGSQTTRFIDLSLHPPQRVGAQRPDPRFDARVGDASTVPRWRRRRVLREFSAPDA